MRNFINENIEKCKKQCQELDTFLQNNGLRKTFFINFIPLKLENNPIINSQESSNGDSNSAASSSCRGDSCHPEIFNEYEIIPVYSGDGYEDTLDNSVLTDDEDFSLPPVIPVINLEKTNNFTSTMFPATINFSKATTSSLSTTTRIVQTTPQPTELVNITTHVMLTNSTSQENLTTEENIDSNKTVGFRPLTTEMTKAMTKTIPTTTISTTTTIKTILKPKIHIWIQGGDGFGDSAKVLKTMIMQSL